MAQYQVYLNEKEWHLSEAELDSLLDSLQGDPERYPIYYPAKVGQAIDGPVNDTDYIEIQRIS